MIAEERLMRILSFIVSSLSLGLAIVLLATLGVRPPPFSTSELNRQIASADRLRVRYVGPNNKLVSYVVEAPDERQVLQKLIITQEEPRRSNVGVTSLEPGIKITPESSSFLASKTIEIAGDQLSGEINGEEYSIYLKSDEAYLRLLLRNFRPAPQLQKIRAVAMSSSDWRVTYDSEERATTARLSDRMMIAQLSEMIQGKQQSEFRYYQYGPSGGIPIAIRFSPSDKTGVITEVHIIRDVMFASINQLNYRVTLDSERLYESLIEISAGTNESSVK